MARKRGSRGWLGSRSRFEREAEAELQFHLDARIDELMGSGFSRTEARRRARIEFGSLEKIKQECREASGWGWIDELRRNAAFGFRLLARNRVFAASAVLTLGLCIGANTAVFSLVDTVLLRPLPYPDPDRLMLVATRFRSSHGESLQLAQDGASWELIREHAGFVKRAVLSDVARGVNLSSGGEPRHVRQQRVGAGLFSVLGVAPLAGREFSLQEDQLGGPAVTVLSAGLAAHLFGDAAAAVGRVVQVRGEPYSVVGVMPAGFDTRTEADLWTPLRPGTGGEGQGTNYEVVVRLPAGLSIEEAQSRIAALGVHDPRQHQMAPGTSRELELVGLQQGWTEHIRPTLTALSFFVLLVLLLGCVNLAGLLMARNGWRRREIAVRMALGGGQAAVTRQLLTESLVLAVAGGGVGFGFGLLAIPLLEALVRDSLGISQPFTLDARTLVFSGAVALVCCFLFGLMPALQAGRLEIYPVLSQAGGRGVARGNPIWSRRILVGSQVALVVVLLVASGLLLRTFSGLRSLDAGFAPEMVTAAKVSLHDSRYASASDVNRFFETILGDLRARPGVEAAGAGLTLPYERALNLPVKFLDGPYADAEDAQLANVFYVTPGYFEGLKMTLLKGRLLVAEDDSGSPRVVVVNQAFVDAYLGREESLGVRLALSNDTREIVGVVGDVQLASGWGNFGPLGRVPAVYMPLAQASSEFLQLVHTWFSPSFVIRTPLSTAEVAALLLSSVQSRDAQMPLFAVQEMREVMAQSWARQRVLAILVAVLSGLALLLAAVGIYGLIANAVVERRREIGIRMALGATLWDAVSTVAMSGIRLTLAGIVVGCVAAYWARELIEHLVWGVPMTDPASYLAAIMILLLTAAVASLAPSLRIVRLDPAETLRK